MTELQLTGYSVESTTDKTIHMSTYAHHKITDLILKTVESKFLKEMGGVQKMVIAPKYVERKKSTSPSQKSSERAEKGPTPASRCEAPSAGTIVTEQGIHIRFRNNGVPAFSMGPM